MKIQLSLRFMALWGRETFSFYHPQNKINYGKEEETVTE